MYLDEDGFYRCSLLINQSVKLSPRLVEPHGLENLNRFEIEVRALKDKPPTVEIIKPSPDTAVRPDDTIQIEFDARDDVGISHAEVVLYKTNEQTGETTPLKTITVPVDQQRNRKRLEASVDIDLSELDLEHGETINYRVDVYDQKQLDGSPASSTENRGSPDDAQSSGGERSPDGSLRPADGDAERQSANNNGGTQSATDSDETQASTAAGESAKTAGDSQSDSESNQDSPNGNSRSGDSASENAQSGDASRGGSSGDQSAERKPSEGNTEDGDPTSAEEDDTATEEDSSSSDEQSMTVDDSQPKDSAGEPTGTADSWNGNDNNDESRRENASASKSVEGDAAEKQASESSPNNSSGGNASNASQSDQQNSSSNSSTSSDSKPSDQQLPPDGGRRPSMRSLDAVKPTSSGEMKLKIDEYAGSFEGESRRKLEIAIDPVLQNLRKWLSACEDLLASAGKNSAETPAWDEGKQQSLSRAIGYLQQSNNAVEALNRKTKGTPYAFVGLQIADIALTHFDPATSDALAALKTESAGRYTLIDSARGQVQRALVRLNELTEKYEREKRDQLLAERIRDFQKMYRVYIEDTLARLQAERERINSIKRKGVEFELDEEYLARLKEVLEMRRDLEAELARILSEDPRLLKRFSQSSRSNADTLRDQFTLLARRQSKLTELAGELRSSSDTETGDPPVGQPLGQLELRTLEVAYRLSGEFGDAVDRFDTWMPLNDMEATAELTATHEGFRQAASRSERLRQAVLAQAQQLTRNRNERPDYESCHAAATEFISALSDLRQRLIALGSNTSNDELASNATNRLTEISQVHDKLFGWRFQVQALSQGRRGEALAVDQHQLMIDLHQYADKMSTLPGQIAALLPEGDGTVPEEIATLSNQLLNKIDTGIEPTQLASVLALRKEDITKARQRMASANTQFDEAEKIFDELMIAIVKILDELPVDDPIASLLDDPTLEEILAQLERELPLNEVLGIPNRPSNLQIMNDWASGGNGGGGGGSNANGDGNASKGGSLPDMIRNAMQSEQRKRQQGLQQLRKILLVVAEDDDEPLNGGFADDDNRWNKVISELGDGLLQQQGGGIPGHFRPAIEQYFETISSATTSQQ